MSDSNRQFATALAAALADLGLAHVCISPGSRNTPLIDAFATESRISKWSLLDERSAAFFAVGLSRATQRPVAIACTSGTASTEYHPAIVEASQSEVPLIVLTADRPSELRNIGAPQTIDQVSLYGSSVKLFADAPTPDDAIGAVGDIAIDLVKQAWLEATTSPAGPVHLNLPFREPLLSSDTNRPRHTALPLPQPERLTLHLDDIAVRLDGRNGLIVAGRSTDSQFANACANLAAALGWPVIADPLSGLRHGPHHQSNVLAAGDALAAADGLDVLTPEVIVRFGPVPTSKSTWRWLEEHPDIEQILIDAKGRDATNSATTTLAISPTAAAIALADAVTQPADQTWLQRWNDLDAAVTDTLTASVDAAAFPNEPAIAQTVMSAVPAGTIVTVGSSMSIRDVDTYGGKSSIEKTIIGNRGTNGIDGLVSVALGSAASGIGAVVLLGDVSLFHDVNSLGTARQLGLPITIVVVNNDGGGIFHFLPQNDPDIMSTAVFENYLATPHATDFVSVAKAFGLEAHEVSNREELAELLGKHPSGPRLIQLRTDRSDNLELHRTISAAVLKTVAASQQ